MIEFQAGNDQTSYVLLLSKNVGNPSWSSLQPFWKSICLLWDELPTISEFSHGVLVSCPDAEEQESGAGASRERGVLRGRWLAQVNIFAKRGEWGCLFISVLSNAVWGRVGNRCLDGTLLM